MDMSVATVSAQGQQTMHALLLSDRDARTVVSFVHNVVVKQGVAPDQVMEHVPPAVGRLVTALGEAIDVG